VTLATLTDSQRADLLREIAAHLGLNYNGVDWDEVIAYLKSALEDAEKYRDLCR
jgi:hypothetical protein